MESGIEGLRRTGKVAAKLTCGRWIDLAKILGRESKRGIQSLGYCDLKQHELRFDERISRIKTS